MIDRRWLPLNALRAFDAVARKGSFTAGAQSLSVTQSAISRHITRLEQLLGQRLIERKGNGLELTDAGLKLLPVLTKSLDRIETALNEIKGAEISSKRVLRIHMPPTFLQKLGLEMLRDFCKEMPDLIVDVSSGPGSGLPSPNLDVAVVYGLPKVSSYIMDLLWMERLAPVCSPELVARLGDRPMQDLLTSAELLHVRVEGQSPTHLWRQFARHAGLDIDVDRGIVFDTQALAVQYAMRGQGVCMCDIDMFYDEIRNMDLCIPLSVEFRDGYGYFLTLRPEDLPDPVISLFRNWAIARFSGADRRAGPLNELPGHTNPGSS